MPERLVPVPGAGHGQAARRAAALAAWAGDLRARRLCARVALDTYYQEPAATATASACARPRPCSPPTPPSPSHSSGSRPGSIRWRRLQPGRAADRATARTATTLARNGELSRFGTLPADLDPVWRQRAEAVAAYRKTLDSNADFTHILESLLHIHHNRYRGIDRDGEGACRRLARQAALTRRAGCLPETA